MVAASSAICYLDGDRGVLGVLRVRHPRSRAGGVVRGGLLPAVARPAPEPRRARRSAVAARGRDARWASRCFASEAAAGRGRHGCAAHAHVGARALRSGGVGQLGAGELSQGGSTDRATREPRRDLRAAAGRRRADPTGSRARTRREFPLHADRQPAERAVDPCVRHRARRSMPITSSMRRRSRPASRRRRCRTCTRPSSAPSAR